MTKDKQFDYKSRQKGQSQKLATLPRNQVSQFYTTTYDDFRRTNSAFIFRMSFVVVLLLGTMSIFGALLYKQRQTRNHIPPVVNPNLWYTNFYNMLHISIEQELTSINSFFQQSAPRRNVFGYYSNLCFTKGGNNSVNDRAMRNTSTDGGAFDYQSTNIGLYSVDQINHYGIPMTSSSITTTLPKSKFLSPITYVYLLDGSSEAKGWISHCIIQQTQSPKPKNVPTYNVFVKVVAQTYNGAHNLPNYLRFLYTGILPPVHSTTLPPPAKADDFVEFDYDMTSKSDLYKTPNYNFPELVSELRADDWVPQVSPTLDPKKLNDFSGFSIANFGNPITDPKSPSNYWFFYSSNKLPLSQLKISNNFFQNPIVPPPFAPRPKINAPFVSDKLSGKKPDYKSDFNFQSTGFFTNQFTNKSSIAGSANGLDRAYEFKNVTSGGNSNHDESSAYQNFFQNYSPANHYQPGDVALNLITDASANTYFPNLNLPANDKSDDSLVNNVMYGFTGPVGNANLGTAFSDMFKQAPNDHISYRIDYGSADGTYQSAISGAKHPTSIYLALKVSHFVFHWKYYVTRTGLANQFWTLANLNRFISEYPSDPNQHHGVVSLNNRTFAPQPATVNQHLFGYENSLSINSQLKTFISDDDRFAALPPEAIDKMTTTSTYYLDIISTCKGNDPSDRGKTYSQIIYRIPVTTFLLPAYSKVGAKFSTNAYSIGIGFDRRQLTQTTADDALVAPIINNSTDVTFAYQGGELPAPSEFAKLLYGSDPLKLQFSNFSLETAYVNESLGRFV